MEIQMKLQNIHQNYHVKRALEVALVGNHSVTLTGDNETALQFQEWGIENDLSIVVSNWNGQIGTDITVKCFAQDRPDTRHLNESDIEIYKRVDNAQKWDDDKPTQDLFDMLLKSAVKKLQLNDDQKSQVFMVAASISRLGNDETLEVISLAEALKYWGK